MKVKEQANFFSKASKKLERELLIKKKRVVQYMQSVDGQQKKILLITGCQRSGTTMMLRLFERDMHSRVFGEFSKLSSHDPRGIKLNELSLVLHDISQCRAEFIVMKPLVESQHVEHLLESLPDARAIWMYRHYKDVASSNLNNFGQGNGVDDLRPIVNQKPGDWRSEKVSEEVRLIVEKYFSEEMQPLDAAALFWYVRNSLFFELHLEQNSDIRIMRYEDLVLSPEEKMREIYHFAGREYPGKEVISQISASSVGKGNKTWLSSDIEKLCQDMLERLDRVYRSQYTTC